MKLRVDEDEGPVVEAVKRQTFKIFSFDTFPLGELQKVSDALKEVGYEGAVVDNGNIVFRKVQEVDDHGEQGEGTGDTQ